MEREEKTEGKRQGKEVMGLEQRRKEFLINKEDEKEDEKKNWRRKLEE